LAEHLAFPAGKFDDDVDCSSLIGRAIDQAHAALVPARWDDEGERDQGRNTTTGY
jgi:phage terminase large subunit-like protein